MHIGTLQSVVNIVSFLLARMKSSVLLSKTLFKQVTPVKPQFKSLTLADKNMKQLRQVMESYIRGQDRIRKRSLEVAVSLKKFGDSEAPQLGAYLNCMSEALSARELLREASMARLNFTCMEPLRYYHVRLLLYRSWLIPLRFLETNWSKKWNQEKMPLGKKLKNKMFSTRSWSRTVPTDHDW